MKYLKTIGVSLGISLIVMWGFLNIPLSIFEDDNFGATIVTITGSDSVKDALKTITNNNFTNLNASKMEMATTSVDSITALSNLATIGTIGTGVWNGSAIGVGYNGTGTTSPTSKQVMIGNGASGFQVIGFGSSGQSLVSGGDATLPSWQSVGINQGDNYNWTGMHSWSNTTTFSATSTMATTTIDKLSLTATSTDYMSAQSKGYIDSRDTKILFYNDTNYSVLLEPIGTTYILAKSYSIDTSTMGVNDKLKIKFNFYCSGTCTSGDAGAQVEIGDGSATTTIANVNAFINDQLFEIELINKSSTSANWLSYRSYRDTSIVQNTWASAKTLNTTGNLYVDISGYSSTQNGHYMTIDYINVELIRY